MAPITINRNTIDPSEVGADLATQDAAKTHFIVVQCHHRLNPQELAELAEKKVEVLRLVEETSYLCKYKPEDLAVLEALSFVKHALVYHNDFVISAPLKQQMEAEDSNTLRAYTIVLHQGTTETGADLLKNIQDFTKAELIDSSAHQLRARIPADTLDRIAKIDYVETIEETKVIQYNSSIATGILKAGDALKPNPVFQGQGEVVAVADHGFDKGSAEDVHPAFMTQNVGKNWSRVLAVVPAGRDSLYDQVGHGTHVAGCAVGDLDDSKGKADPYNVNRMQGTAPKAQLYFQAIAPGENVIPDMDTLFSTAAKANAKIHNDAWGARSVKSNTPQETYTQAESFPIDREMWQDRELLIVWSAGNEGSTWTTYGPGGPPVYRQIGAETASKNSLVVSSTYNNRYMQPQNLDVCIDGEDNPSARGTLTSASQCDEGASKGPTTDLRLKPDVVAPGVGILSALSRAAKENSAARKGGHGECKNTNFCFMAGTSHAAPLVAGCAAALREALKKAGF